MNFIDVLEKTQLKKNLPKINVGDKVKVSQKIREGGKQRSQAFEGIVISKRGKGINLTITVRKIAVGGIGVERGFPLHSKTIEKIKILKKGKVRKAQLYYLRGRAVKRTRLKEKAVSPEEVLEWEEPSVEKISEKEKFQEGDREEKLDEKITEIDKEEAEDVKEGDISTEELARQEEKQEKKKEERTYDENEIPKEETEKGLEKAESEDSRRQEES